MTVYKLPNCLEITDVIDGKLRLFKRTFNPPLMKYCGGINERWRSVGKPYNLKRKDEIIYYSEIIKAMGRNKL
jgi:hypothetical protein